MVLDTRLKKLATGIPARDAARAHAKSLLPGESLSDVEKSQAAEFAATIEAMFLMAAVDGEISPEEIDQLAASIQAIADTQHLKAESLEKVLAGLNKKLDRDGWSARLDAVVSRLGSEEARSFAFRLAAGVAFVDDRVAYGEAAALAALAAKLALSSDDSQQIQREVQEMLFG